MKQVHTHYDAGFVIGLVHEDGEAHLILNDRRIDEALALALKDGFPLVLWWDAEAQTFRAVLTEPGDTAEPIIDHALNGASTFGGNGQSPTRALRFALGYWWGDDEEWAALTEGDGDE